MAESGDEQGFDPPSILSLSETELDHRQERITTFIQSTVETAGADGAVIGLSGGIDSTLTATLAAEALGPDQVHALILPGTVSRSENMSDAERIAEDLEVPMDLVEIDNTVNTILESFPATDPPKEATGNVRARVRAVYTYFIANTESRIVLGTGNRTEALVGYFTKYGDQAVDCNPIGNLYKCQVRQLARHVDIPEPIITKPPSAGLWTGQTDEEELGLTYDTLDGILALHVDGPASRTATASKLDIPVETVDRVSELVAQSAHKRSMPPTPDHS